jgi:hypothetical protein
LRSHLIAAALSGSLAAHASLGAAAATAADLVVSDARIYTADAPRSIEAARKSDGGAMTHDGLAHLQVVDPADVTRFGHDHLHAAFTYAWMNTQPGYDVTVISAPA